MSWLDYIAQLITDLRAEMRKNIVDADMAKIRYLCEELDYIGIDWQQWLLADKDDV